MQKIVKNPPLRVVISLDVEEEGLFSGTYASQGCTVRNVALLPRLLPLSQELGFPLTLLCAHTVLTDSAACHVLARMRDQGGAEIGAHLHHWSTPPADVQGPTPGHNRSLDDGDARDAQDAQDAQDDRGEKDDRAHSGPPRSHTMDRDLLRQRLRTLLRAGQAFQGSPLTAFRMGRWDLKSSLRPLLAEEGILVDSSVSPLRYFGGGPDHFLAPSDPYWVDAPAGSSPPPLLEVPITQVPCLPALARAWYALGKALPLPEVPQRANFLDAYKFFGALSANPVWHKPPIMRMATRLHVARGGRVLSLFWHSSEMLPGASPNIPDQAAADALLQRVRDFLVWLRAHYEVQGVTLSSLYTDPLAPSFPHLPAEAQGAGDW